MESIVYKDLTTKIGFLSKKIESNKVIIREYYRRLERDVENFLRGEIKKSMMDIVEQIKFGLVDPTKVMNDFIAKNEKKMTYVQKITIQGDVEKIVLKLKESDKELNSNINNIIRMIQNYYRQETSQVNKKNVAKYFYNIVDNKLRGTISYQYMTKILKWSLNNISKKTQI